MSWRDLQYFSFGDTPALADELLALVLAERKTATCSAARDGQQTEVCQRWAVRDGAGRLRAVIETTELTQRRWEEVDEAFAHDEGEGDRSLASWRENHRVYFARNGGFAEDMLLWCERFRLVEVIAEAGGP
jgi:uncharacterized protein YhfF